MVCALFFLPVPLLLPVVVVVSHPPGRPFMLSSVCVCVCVRACVRVCVCVRARVYMYVPHVCVYICVYARAHIYIYICVMCECIVYVRVRGRMCVCARVCDCVWEREGREGGMRVRSSVRSVDVHICQPFPSVSIIHAATTATPATSHHEDNKPDGLKTEKHIYRYNILYHPQYTLTRPNWPPRSPARWLKSGRTAVSKHGT